MTTLRLIDYALIAGDTLESLAYRFLGTSARWQELATLNTLRWPYISDVPRDRLGLNIGTTSLLTPVAAGAKQVTLANPPLALRAGCVLLFERQTGAGLETDTATVLRLNNLTGIATLDTALVYAYPLRQSVLLFTPARDTTGRVAQTGDSIRVPVEGGNVALPRPDLLDALGVDLDAQDGALRFFALRGQTYLQSALGASDTTITVIATAGFDAPGELLIGFERIRYTGLTATTFTGCARDPLNATTHAANTPIYQYITGASSPDDFGHLHTVRGVQTISQAITHRLQVPEGELTLHPTFGSRLHLLVGERNTPLFLLRGEAALRDALRGDPRIRSVEQVSLQIDADTIRADLQVVIDDTETLLSLENLAIGVI